MKALLEQVPLCTDSSFLVREFNVPYFEAPLHFHPVYELTLITESKGKRFIGDHIGNFDVGDLVFMSPDVPHFYRCDPAYYAHDPAVRARAIIIQFAADFLGGHFFSAPETSTLLPLFEKARRGICFYGKTRDDISRRLKKIRFAKGIERLLQLLTILDILAQSDEYEVLSSPAIVGQNPRDTDRMNKVYEFVMVNFQKVIILEEVALLANMSCSAFCRYFKKRTRKTFSTFLNEIRIGYACKLLLEENLSITEICFAAGFNNLSNFNRQFRAITHVSPRQYRQQYCP